MMTLDSFAPMERFQPLYGEGEIFLDDQRVMMTSTAAMGMLRNDLISMVGTERMKRFLVRYGWSLGVHDATLVFQNKRYTNIEDMVLAGPKMHTKTGHVYVQPITLQVDQANNYLFMEGIWKHSYEAEEHRKLFGVAEEPTCYTLIGYASGYLSTIVKTKVIVKETSCSGMGHEECHWVAKSLPHWKNEADDILDAFKETSMLKELEQAYQNIKTERDNLNKSFLIHKRLMKELTLGNNLQSIAHVLYSTMEVPVIIEDQNFQLLASAGLSMEEQMAKNKEMQHKFPLNKHLPLQKSFSNDLDTQEEQLQINLAAAIQISKTHWRLIYPIYLNQKINGYCSFIRPTNDFNCMEKMVIERTSAVCALYLLNKRTAIEAEQRIRGNILEEILSNQLSRQEIYQRSHFIGLKMDSPFYMIVIKDLTNKKDIQEELEWKNTFIQQMTEYFRKIDINILATHKPNHSIILLSKDELTQQHKHIQNFPLEILKFCKKKYPGHSFRMGISLLGEHLEQANQRYQEALAAVNISGDYTPIVYYEDLGMLGILLQTGEQEMMKQYAEQYLKRMLDFDCQRNMDLLKTLYYYILNGGNLEQTSVDLNLSISGLRYRMEKIKELLEEDIREPAVSYQLFLAIQTLILLGEINLT